MKNAVTSLSEDAESQAFRRSGVHPMIFRTIGPDPKRDEYNLILYDPRMKFPAPDDKAGILDFMGLNSEMAADVIKTLEDTGDTPPPPVDITGTEFPLTKALYKVYEEKIRAGGNLDDFESDYGELID
jgi:hypothetical protein